MQSSTPATSIFSPEGELGIYSARESKQQLLALLASAGGMQIDLQHVSLLDSAGLQLLVMAKQEATRRRIPLSLTNLSQPVTEVLDLCNLSGFFADQVFIPSQPRKAGESP
jgi:anti-sigma B factor antagonist